MSEKNNNTKMIPPELQKVIDKVLSYDKSSTSESRGHTLIGNNSRRAALTPPNFRDIHPPINLFSERNGKPTEVTELLPQNPVPTPTAPPANSNDILKAHLSEIGKKGGSREKKSKSILEAVKTFMRENAKMRGWSNERIAKLFHKKYNDNKPLIVTIGNTKWDVYCSGDLIFYRMAETYGRKANNEVKSIKYNTLLNTYVPQAKKAVFTEIPQ